jgi:hypothetical protein
VSAEKDADPRQPSAAFDAYGERLHRLRILELVVPKFDTPTDILAAAREMAQFVAAG